MPDWLEALSQRIAALLEPADPRAPIGCHVCRADDVWELTFFVSRTEIFGGEYDGRSVPGRFVLDLAGLLTTLDEVSACWWQPLPQAADDDLGPQVSIEGRYGEHPVWIRITAEQPLAIESGRVANMLGGTIERRW